MYENQTYDNILQRLLDSVTESIDKREGSLIYNALAPAAAELAQMYLELNNSYNLVFADTATENYLTRRCAEFGINRNPATKSIRIGFATNENNDPVSVPLNTKFGLDGLIYMVIEEALTGFYLMECQTPGTIGNKSFGEMQSIDFVNGLAKMIIDVVVVPGEDEETDEQLRKRYFEAVNSPAFGGNKADYRTKTKEIDGVGDLKVFPVWDGGGTVKLVIIDSDYNAASATLIDTVQEKIDPSMDGSGLGIAPIGHVVTVIPAGTETINISTTLTLQSGYSLASMQSLVENVLDTYLLDLKKSWGNETNTIVRISQIDSRILEIPGIVDVVGTKVNNLNTAYTLNSANIPIRGTVTLSGS